MARIPLVSRDQVAEGSERLEALRTYLRDEASLSQKLQELVMISVAREIGCAFIWYAHAAPIWRAGLRDDLEDSIRDRIGRPYTTAGGKNSHVRVQRLDKPGGTETRLWGLMKWSL